MTRPPQNTSYFFIPFRFDSQSEFRDLIAALNEDENWICVHDEIRYMLKYVADKIDSKNPDNCQCFHFELTDQARQQFGIASKELWYSTKEHTYQNLLVSYRFHLDRIQLYCFSTTVCIMAFQVIFEENMPLWISSAQYYLKKVSREFFLHPNGTEMSFLALAQKLMEQVHSHTNFDFFYYANPSTERANVLTYLEVPPKEDYRYELYFLRRCYHENFVYSESTDLASDEVYTASKGITWGFSQEAAVCLACPAYGREEFIYTTFYKNFNAQYLFMYVLLLHQKYVLYMFLTIIGLDTYNDLEKLEAYRQQLYEFETDFVFSCITEVPQYQILHEKLSDVFSLKKMYEDVREPLVSLSEVRRANAEKRQRNNDYRMNKSLAMLSLLTLFSALIDSFDFVESFLGQFFNQTQVSHIQICAILIICVIVFFVIYNLLKSKSD